LQRDPFNVRYHLGKAIALDHLGRTEQAETAFRRAIATQPDHWLAYNQLAKFLYARGRYAEAADMFEQILVLAPDSFWAYNGLGICRFAMNDDDRAVQCFEKSLSLRETDIAYSNLGTHYFYKRDFENAAKASRKAIEVNDREHRNWANLGAALRWLGKTAESQEAYRRAAEIVEKHLDLNPRSAELLSMCSDYHSGFGDHEKALALAEQALQISPNSAIVLFRTASLFIDAFGDGDTAMRYLQRAVECGFSMKQILSAASMDTLRGRRDFRLLTGLSAADY
jgi:tetratricopeptide (TPR) repeat protein